MQDYHTGIRIHYSSGVPNRAFYLTCKEIGNNNYSWEKALKDRPREYSRFQDAADAVYDIAGSVFGKDTKEQNAVYKGWEVVCIHQKKPLI